jgi:hypothetical protein
LKIRTLDEGDANERGGGFEAVGGEGVHGKGRCGGRVCWCCTAVVERGEEVGEPVSGAQSFCLLPDFGAKCLQLEYPISEFMPASSLSCDTTSILLYYQQEP